MLASVDKEGKIGTFPQQSKYFVLLEFVLSIQFFVNKRTKAHSSYSLAKRHHQKNLRRRRMMKRIKLYLIDTIHYSSFLSPLQTHAPFSRPFYHTIISVQFNVSSQLTKFSIKKDSNLTFKWRSTLSTLHNILWVYVMLYR